MSERKCKVFGKVYNSIKEAQQQTYDKNICKCEKCGKVITYSQWYQWCQRYLNANNGHIICHSCKSSLNISSYNNSEKHFEDLSKRDKLMWKDKKYRNKMTKVLRKNFKKQKNDKNSLFNKQLKEYLQSEENANKLLQHVPNQLPHDEFFSENPRLYFELYRRCNQEKTTYLYIGYLYNGRNAKRSYKQLDGKYWAKVGITTDINARKHFNNKDSGVKKYCIVREFKNRREAALCEYLIIDKYCSCNEAFDIKLTDKVEKFVNNFSYDNYKHLISKYLEKYFPDDLN